MTREQIERQLAEAIAKRDAATLARRKREAELLDVPDYAALVIEARRWRRTTQRLERRLRQAGG